MRRTFLHSESTHTSQPCSSSSKVSLPTSRQNPYRIPENHWYHKHYYIHSPHQTHRKEKALKLTILCRAPSAKGNQREDYLC